MTILEVVKNALNEQGDQEKAAHHIQFFKTLPGEYGEGDIFNGVTVPEQRKIAQKYYKDMTLNEAEKLLQDPIHELRLTALFILVYKFEKAKNEDESADIANLYLHNYNYVNNWDLVDSSADKILGPFLLDKPKDILYEFANSDHLWKQRIAIITTFHFIKNNCYDDTLKMAKLLLNHQHDLIHKAVGWMLREIGKKDFQVEFDFLKAHYKQMPRTMLRYAIEKFDEELRQKFLKGIV